ncbi:MAG: 4a-hydroxytetrahydrobiopterin dehydratase [Actinomycetota bacterium]|nr:4a-hydroxytetrahydrobiopterin dehydratase [Actinomycetota bacterium]
MQQQIDSAWEREANRSIRRVFTFPNFRDAFTLATQVALLAESQGHHPDLEVSWGRLVVTLMTHSAGGLTESDFIMAAKIDGFTR